MYCITLVGKSLQKVISTISSLQVIDACDWVLVLKPETPEVDSYARALTAIDTRIVVVDEGGGQSIPKDTIVLPVLEGDLILKPLLQIGLSFDEKCFYTDSIAFSNDGAEAYPKPSFSPELQFSTNFVERLFFSSSFSATAGVKLFLHSEFDTYHNVLEFLKLGMLPRHVAIVGYQVSRLHQQEEDWKNNIAKAKTYAEYFGYSGTTCLEGVWSARYQRNIYFYDQLFSDSGEDVEIIIPSKNNHGVLEICISSILELTSYKNYKITIADNASKDQKTLAFYKGLKDPRVSIVRVPNKGESFSFSYINNRIAFESRATYLCFLNDDTEVISREWLSHLVGWAKVPGVCGVGALLFYPDRTVQHTGICHKALSGMLPMTVNRGLRDAAHSFRGGVFVPNSCSAVSAACMLTSRELFVSSGGFDELDFNVAYNDCDYGFRHMQKGLRSIYSPRSRVVHHEGYSRGVGLGNDNPREESAFIKKYCDFADPYWNKNYCLTDTSGISNSLWRADNYQVGLRVGLFSHNLNLEGAPLVLLEVAKGLKVRGYSVTFISPLDGPLRSRLEQVGICSVISPSGGIYGYKNEDAYISQLREVQDVLRDGRFDAIITNTVLSLHVAIAAELAGIPAVAVVHESEVPFSHLEEHGGVYSIYAKKLIHQLSQIVFVSDTTRTLYREKLGLFRNTTVIYNGFDVADYGRRKESCDKSLLRKRYGINDDTLVGICLGSVCERKRQLDALDLVSKLEVPIARRFVLFVVGARNNAYSNQLREGVASLGEKAGCIRVIEETEYPEHYLSAADFFISFSSLESYPKSIQEALFFDLPVLSTNVFGVRELVSHGHNGLLFDVADIDKAAQYVRDFLMDNNLRDRLASQCKYGVMKFNSFASMVSSYEELLLSAKFRNANFPGYVPVAR